VINEEAAPRTSLAKQVLTYGATLVVAAVAIYGLSELLAPLQPPEQANSTGSTASVAPSEQAATKRP
jgi:TctA family transporter